jgi:recombination protein RecA
MSKSDNILENFFRSYSDAEDMLDYRVANQVIAEKLEVIKTGSAGLDDALSSGGLPYGRIIQFYGKSHSGKTVVSMLCMLEAQKKDPKSKQIFIDAEGTFSEIWARALGLDTSRIVVIDGDTAVNGRNLFNMLIGVPKEDAKHILSGKSKLGLLDHIAAKDPGFEFNMITLDSLGAIIPPIEDVSAVGKSNMSTMARFLSSAMKKLSLEVKKANIPFVIINHNRDNMDPYGSDHGYSGGNTYSHFLSANIYFEAVMRKDSQILDDKEQKLGHTIRATVEKSKFGISPRKIEFKIDFTKGYADQHLEIANLALSYDIVQKPTAVSHTYKDKKWVGFNNFAEALKEDKNLFDELSEAVIQAREHKLDKKRTEQALKIDTTSDTTDIGNVPEELIEPKKSKTKEK